MKLKLSNKQSKDSSLFGYADATWADDSIERKSNSGRIFYLNGGTISWGCNKQKIVAQSSCDAEYISISVVAKEAKWLRQLLEEINEVLTTLKALPPTRAIAIASDFIASDSRMKRDCNRTI